MVLVDDAPPTRVLSLLSAARALGTDRKGLPPMTSEEALQYAQEEGLELFVADNKTGYFGVCHSQSRKAKPYVAQVKYGGKQVHLGSFATAEEAALCIARSPEGQYAVVQREAASPPLLTSEEALQQAQAEKLTLLVAKNKAGYFGVTSDHFLPNALPEPRGSV